MAEGYGVLVHCAQGVSRSASLILAFLMRKHNMSLKAAYQLLKQKRPVVKPNTNFLRQARGAECLKRDAVSYSHASYVPCLYTVD